MFSLSKIRSWINREKPNRKPYEVIQISSVDIFDLHRIVAIHKGMGLPLIEFKLPLSVAKIGSQVVDYTLVDVIQEQLTFKTTITFTSKNDCLQNDLEEYSQKMVNRMFCDRDQEYSRLDGYSKKLVNWLSSLAE